MGLKRIIIIIVCIIIFLAIVGGWVGKHLYELSMQFDDLNGDDKSLAIITDDMINRYFEDYRAIRRTVSSKTNNEIRISGKYEDCDRSYVKTQIGMLSGIYISNAYKGIDANVTYKIESSVKSGNLKIVITDEDNNILHDIPIDQKYEVTFFAYENKCYYVKFIGESADINIIIERTE